MLELSLGAVGEGNYPTRGKRAHREIFPSHAIPSSSSTSAMFVHLKHNMIIFSLRRDTNDALLFNRSYISTDFDS